MDSLSTPALSKILGGFTILEIGQDDPIVQTRADSFHTHMGILKPRRPDVVKWYAFFKNENASLVVALYMRPDSGIEVTDFYPAPTRDGVRAGYAGLRLLKLLVDEKIIPFWIGGIVFHNDFGRRHAEKFFGIKPCTAVYRYGGGP